ncbi:putative peptidase [Jeotgalicoccus saudimassiliensis]|uniref:Putative peptidase n=1 Tax=Jeotgalicoccus saudimassiliensis TaxID=1461582 RepID=A0A078MDV8_9STAP|nr:aminopeptidase P family protein [Jeotgalicoccus saudimassiliensis]CEA02916.1 putative peptidase [Jeotgalicoccus saudimassiliensis]
MTGKIEALAKSVKADYSIISDPMNIFYFSGVHLEPHERLLLLLVDNKTLDTAMIYPALDGETVKANTDLTTYLPHDDQDDAFQYVFDTIPEGKTVAVEGEHLIYSRYLRLIEKYAPENISTLDDEVNYLRGKKNERDKAELQRAVDMTEKALEDLKTITVEGKTEMEISDFLVKQFKSYGAVGPSFGPSVLAGKKSAMPHGETGTNVIERGDFLLIDFGVVSDTGYVSDMTRTFIVGEATKEQEEIYKTVLRSNLEGIKASQAGTVMGDIDRASRDVIEDAGYGEYFMHRIGHGLGHDVHEAPSIHGGNTDKLEAGHVITIEPGIYNPEIGGVRIEDMLYIDEDTTYNFNSFPKDFESMIIK